MINNFKVYCACVLAVAALTANQLFANEHEDCLRTAIETADDTQTVGALKQQCPDPVTEKKPSTSGQSPLHARLDYEKSTWDKSYAISAYRPNYFLPLSYNSNPNNAPIEDTGETFENIELKFQISLKAPVIRNLFTPNNHLFFAYTNQTWWQGYNGNLSQAIRETNHEPELYVRMDTDWKLGPITNKLLAVGFVHQSNGRYDEYSRNWNRLYVKFTFEVTENLYFSLKPWWRESHTSKENTDIEDYMGNGEFRALYIFGNQNLGMMLRNNLKSSGNKGAIQLDWSFPLHEKLRGYVQYFNGYGESLMDYNSSVNRLSVGFLITDWL